MSEDAADAAFENAMAQMQQEIADYLDSDDPYLWAKARDLAAMHDRLRAGRASFKAMRAAAQEEIQQKLIRMPCRGQC